MKKITIPAVFLLVVSLAVSGCGQTAQKEPSVKDNNSGSSDTESGTQDASNGSETTSQAAGEIVSNRLFSLTMPAEFSGLYETETGDNYIYVYHKESKAAGFGGFEFGVRAYASPAEYGGGPFEKIGEVTSADGTLYDIVRYFESEIQTDYEKEEPESYRKIYDAADSILSKLTATEGNSFSYGAGTKGADLYKDILQKHITAIKEKWDSSKLEEENMSTMYYTMSEDGQGNVIDRIGYCFHDVNVDGIDELFIGEIADGDWKGVIYDMYGMSDRKPVHIATGWARNRYYVCNPGTTICNEYSSSAAESGWTIYDYPGNATELHPMVGFKTDLLANEQQPWFVSYNVAEDEWENITESDFNERKASFEDYMRFDYIPLSSVAGN